MILIGDRYGSARATAIAPANRFTGDEVGWTGGEPIGSCAGSNVAW